MTTETLAAWFEEHQGSRKIFDIVAKRISELGPAEVIVGSQISFKRKRKFAWFWLYNVTNKNPDGVPHLMLALDKEVNSPHVRNIDRIGPKRWNHQIVLRSIDDARSKWLGDLLRSAYQYGQD
jgi:Domain of unknown function (DUF5655)